MVPHNDRSGDKPREQRFKEGLEHEAIVAEWFAKGGWNVITTHGSRNGSPELWCPDGVRFKLPDLFIFDGDQSYWIEVKGKEGPTWHQKTRQLQVGIDRDLYHGYHYAAMKTRRPVLVFLVYEPGKRGRDVPEDILCPSGLFFGRLSALELAEDHVDYRYGRSGIVFFNLSRFRRVSDWPPQGEVYPHATGPDQEHPF